LPEAGSAERELTIAGLLASRFTDTAILDALPAEHVLASDAQREQVAARIIEAFETAPEAWARLARWSRTAGADPEHAEVEFGRLLQAARDDVL
jgi:hypothetical protein